MIIEYDAVCSKCKGTGLYKGLCERGYVAVVCYSCKGTGCNHVHIEYEPFRSRAVRHNIDHVVECNPGIIIGLGGSLTIDDIGGMPYSTWLEGKSFPAKSEMRKFVCPAWWYQLQDYKLKPDWDECDCFGSTFSSCTKFKHKGQCWNRWDNENIKDSK
jgi:hypothetical protein